MHLMNQRHGMAVIGISVAIVLMTVPPVSATVVELSFSQIVSRADVIFHGTVVAQESYYGEGARMIFTDTTFAIEEVIHHRPEAKSLVGDRLVLTSAGGRIGDFMINVSITPKFVTGEQYVVFTRYDGARSASPVVGASQGVFRITVDDATGIAYPLSADRCTLTGIDNEGMTYGPRTERVSHGAPVKSAPPIPDLRFEVAPQPVGISAEQGASAGAGAMVSTKHARLERPLTLDDFIEQIRRHLIDNPTAER